MERLGPANADADADGQLRWFECSGASGRSVWLTPSRSKKKVRLKRHRTLSLIRPFFIHLD